MTISLKEVQLTIPSKTSQLTNDSGFATTALATTASNGLMVAADKLKLDGVAAGANNFTYIHPSTHPASIIVGDSSNRFTTDAEKTAWNAKANQSDLVAHLADNVQQFIDLRQFTTTKLYIDTNNIFTEIDLKRHDGTLIMKSVLSGGTSPLYTTRTETYYAINGTTVTSTAIYTRNYNSDGILTSEVIN